MRGKRQEEVWLKKKKGALPTGLFVGTISFAWGGGIGGEKTGQKKNAEIVGLDHRDKKPRTATGLGKGTTKREGAKDVKFPACEV